MKTLRVAPRELVAWKARRVSLRVMRVGARARGVAMRDRSVTNGAFVSEVWRSRAMSSFRISNVGPWRF